MQHLRANVPAVVHQTIDSETVIINLERGIYYSPDRVGLHRRRVTPGRGVPPTRSPGTLRPGSLDRAPAAPRLRPAGSGLDAPAALPRYLPYAWDLGTLRALPRGALRRTLKRLRGTGVGTA
jgi:hypothetical protein